MDTGDKVEAAPKRKPGRPKKEAPETVTVICIVPNVWTETGKLYAKDRATLPRAEAEFLSGRDQVVILE